jgi:hypothetical protein
MANDTKKESENSVYRLDQYVKATQDIIANSILLLAVVVVSLAVSLVVYFYGL